MALAVPQERDHEDGVPLNTLDEQLDQNTPKLYDATRSEGQNEGENKEQGIIAEGPPTAVPEHNGDQLGEDPEQTVRSGGSSGERRYQCRSLFVDVYRFQRETSKKQRLRFPPFGSAPQRSSQVDLVPLKPP